MSKKLYGILAENGPAMLGTAEEMGREILARQGLSVGFDDSDSYFVCETDDDEVEPLYRRPLRRRESESVSSAAARAYADVFRRCRGDGVLDINSGKQVLAFLPYDSVLDSVSAREVRENKLDTRDELALRRYVYDRAATC